MKTFLPSTTAELALWRAAERTLPVWWRDDDATHPSPALDRLLALADTAGAPLHLAVIPQPATAALADRLRGELGVHVLTHGWRHVNHAPAGRKKAEFGADRPLEARAAEAEAGRLRLAQMFGVQALPVFTPPWNRIAPDMNAALAEKGCRSVSTYLARPSKYAASGLLAANTHLDPIDWKAGGGLIDPALLDAQMSRDLQARRLGSADDAEPYGLLTHHLVQDAATWAFIADFLDMLAASGVAVWTSPLAEL